MNVGASSTRLSGLLSHTDVNGGHLVQAIECASSEIEPEGSVKASFMLDQVNPSHCLARVVRDGKLAQCKARPWRQSSTCFQHRTVRGCSRARFGLLDGDVPPGAIDELQSLLHSGSGAASSLDV